MSKGQASMYAPDYLRLQKDQALHNIAGMIESQINKIQTLQEQNKAQAEEIEKLKSDREKLSECVKFYASWKNWNHSDHPDHEIFLGAIKRDDSEIEFSEADGELYKAHFGGKLARQALKQIGEIE